MNGIAALVISLSAALLATLILELPVFLAGYRKDDLSLKYKLAVFVLINAITNLCINSVGLLIRDHIYDSYGRQMWMAILILEEAVVVIVEALVYKKAFVTGLKKPLLISIAANAVSGILGSYLLWALR